MKKIESISKLIDRYPVLAPLEETLPQVVGVLTKQFQDGHTLLVCGNGGSASDSLHITGELMKSFQKDRPLRKNIAERVATLFPEELDFYLNNLEMPLPCISLVSELSLLTAFANDKNSDLSFAQQVLGYGKEGAVLFCLSTSGNSPNILHAAKIAKVMGMTVISMTGETGGKLAKYSDILLNVPEKETYLVQELHLPLYHAICLAVETEIFS